MVLSVRMATLEEKGDHMAPDYQCALTHGIQYQQRGVLQLLPPAIWQGEQPIVNLLNA
jgi:hypothetical protein